MSTIACVLVALVALEHLYILWIEMFAWTTRVKEVFRDALPEELFEPTRGLAANQGLYNGFLAAGLIWGTNHRRPRVVDPSTDLLPLLCHRRCWLWGNSL